MSDNQAQPPGGPRPNDPWAPPEGGDAAGRVPLDKPSPPSVHDQPTVIGMPGAGPGDTGSVPPPPVAPGGPAPVQPPAGAYGYPAAPAMPQAPATGFGAPDPYGAGYPGYPGYGQTGWQPSPANGMGITAMVLGIVATVLFCLYGLGIVLGVLALIFGFIGRARVRRGEATNGGMALAGIILGAVGVVISAVFLALVIYAINEEASKDDFDYDGYSNQLVVDLTR